MQKVPKFYKPDCEDPLLIVNRRALYLMSLPGCEVHNVPMSFKPYDGEYITRLLRNAHRMTESDLQGCYVRLGCQVELVYRWVPCNHCSICRKSKRNEFVMRCILEQQLYDCPPYTFCLTYDEQHLPRNGEICYRDVQLFFKRLRKRWTKMGLPDDWRYAVACEYGHDFGRPHYHILLFNNPYRCSELDVVKHDCMKRDVWEAWRNDQWKVFSDPQNFRQCYGGIAAYMSKYMCKGSRWDAMHVNKSKMYMSTHHGGLGVPYLDKFTGYYQSLDEPDKFQYLDMSDGLVKDMPIVSFIKRRYWPSPLATVPHRIRAAYRDMQEVIKRSYEVGWMSRVECMEFLRYYRPDHVPDWIDYDQIDRHGVSDYGFLTEDYVRDRFGQVLLQCIDILKDWKSDYDLEHYYDILVNRKFCSSSDVAGKAFRAKKEDAITLVKTKF